MDVRMVVERAALTKRELEILGLLLAGASAKEMAFQLAVAQGTVRRHLQNLYKKFGGKTHRELLAYFVDAAGTGRDVRALFR